MKKPKARITVMFEYDLDEVKGLSPEQVLDLYIAELQKCDGKDVKIAIVRKEVL